MAWEEEQCRSSHAAGYHAAAAAAPNTAEEGERPLSLLAARHGPPTTIAGPLPPHPPARAMPAERRRGEG